MTERFFHEPPLFTKSQFNYTYYTVAHKSNMRQLLAVAASYENKHCPGETGKSLCARLNASFFGALYHCAAKFFFVLFLLLD